MSVHRYAPAWSGRVRNIVDTIFFTPDVCAAERLQTSCDPIGENTFAYFAPGAALAGGMVGKSEHFVESDY